MTKWREGFLVGYLFGGGLAITVVTITHVIIRAVTR
jgi:hypothetical protein